MFNILFLSHEDSMASVIQLQKQHKLFNMRHLIRESIPQFS